MVMVQTIQNSEGPEIFPYLPMNKVACQRFMNADRRYKKAEFEAKALSFSTVAVVTESPFPCMSFLNPNAHSML